MKRAILTLLAFCTVLAAQTQTVAISAGSPDRAYTALFFYSGNNLQYICRAPATPIPAYSWSVTAQSGLGTLASIAVSTNVGTVTVVGNHGLQVGNLITVSGSTTSALNKNYVIQTVGSTTTFTISTSGVGDATYSTAALKVASTAPRSSAAQWSIQYLTYDGSNNLLTSQWAGNVSTGQGGSTSYSFICDNRASLAYQ